MKTSLRTLILDRENVRDLLDMKAVVEAVEGVFAEYGRGRASMPPKVYLDLPRWKGDFRAMPAYVEKSRRAGLKWVNTHASNPQHGLPAVMATVILSDPSNGFPLSIMDGTLLTAYRTGAAGAVAARYLARRDSQTVALVGCGAQARTQLMALREVFKVKRVQVWGKERDLMARFIKEMRRAGEGMDSFPSVEACVAGADIIVTTTPSRVPVIQDDWIKPGTHINAIGADAAGKEELDPKILKRAKVVVDDTRQASHSGEINVPLSRGVLTRKNIYAELGEIVCRRKNGRTSEREITVFDSTGLAIQDIAVAELIYSKALRKRIGRKVDLVGLG